MSDFAWPPELGVHHPQEMMIGPVWVAIIHVGLRGQTSFFLALPRVAEVSIFSVPESAPGAWISV